MAGRAQRARRRRQRVRDCWCSTWPAAGRRSRSPGRARSACARSTSRPCRAAASSCSTSPTRRIRARLGSGTSTASSASSTSATRRWRCPTGPTSPRPNRRPSPTADSAASGTFAVADARATSAAVLDVGWAVAVDALADGTVLVLDRFGPDGHFEVSRWRCGERRPVRAAARRAGRPGHGLRLHRPARQRSRRAGRRGGPRLRRRAADGRGRRLARLFVVDDRGDQAFEFVVDEDGADLVTAYHPLRLFSGKALIAATARIASYDLDDRWYPVPTQPVERYATDAVVVLAPGPGAGRGVRRRRAGHGVAPAGRSTPRSPRAPR